MKYIIILVLLASCSSQPIPISHEKPLSKFQYCMREAAYYGMEKSKAHKYCFANGVFTNKQQK